MSEETFLEEQLKRIRQMSERMSEVQSQIREYRSPSTSNRRPVERGHAEDASTHRRVSRKQR